MRSLFNLLYTLPLYVVIGVVGFATSPACSQNSVVPNSLNPQQQSVAFQMEAIVGQSAQTQADSIRRQAASVRQQYGVSLNGTEKSTLETAADNLAAGKNGPIGNLDLAPVRAADPGDGNPPPVNSPAASPSNVSAAGLRDAGEGGFFTVPWRPSVDFVMPNVEIAAISCDALGNTAVNQLVDDASGKYKLDPALLRAVMRQESGLRPCAMSTAGAMGLMQIMPDTAGDLGLADPFDPSANVDAGAHYLKQLLNRYNGNTALALAAYNAGPARTDKANGIPPISETIGYVSSILSGIPLF